MPGEMVNVQDGRPSHPSSLGELELAPMLRHAAGLPGRSALNQILSAVSLGEFFCPVDESPFSVPEESGLCSLDFIWWPLPLPLVS